MTERVMNLQIRDPLAHELARRLAERRGVSMTEAVIVALRAEIERLGESIQPSPRVDDVLAEVDAYRRTGRAIAPEHLDDMWGMADVY